MFNKYLKYHFRNLRKSKSHSFINIFGLAIGIACAGLIFLWVEDEINFDSINVKKNKLYQVKVNDDMDNGVFTHSSTPGVMAPSLQQDLQTIANACRMTEGETTLLFNKGDKPLYASGHYADPSVFDLFSISFLQGNAKNAFTDLYSLVITEKAAKKFFGTSENVLGKTIRVDNKQDYVIAGVVKDIPENSSLKFEWLAPFQIYYDHNPNAHTWNNFCVSTFVELKDHADLKQINKQLANYIQVKQGSASSTVHVFLFSMNDWHLYDDFENGLKSGKGRIQYVRLFSLIACIILFIACFNFMNLSTARSEKRAKEVGVRKVLGASRKGLVYQFLSEGLFMAFLAGVAAIGIIYFILPEFNSMVQKELVMNLLSLNHLVALFVIILLCGLVASSYPSFYLSSFNPAGVLKGIKIKSGSAAWIRKGLVVMQFAVSIILILGTIIIYQQIQHVKTRNLGFDKNNLIQMKLEGNMIKNFSVLKQDLINSGVVENVALTDHETITSGNNTTAIDWAGKNPNSNIRISQRVVSPEFLSTSRIEIKEGRDFIPTDIIELGKDYKVKDSNKILNVIITSSFEKIIGNGSALGKVLKDNMSNSLRIVGVTKDYVFGNMYGKGEPVLFYCLPDVTRFAYIRIKPHSDPESAIARISAVLKKDNPAYPMVYSFVDDQFNKMFQSEMLISKLSGVFATLAIIISCLGLFGLATYSAERRKKEIGIRKVLGSSITGIISLLSKDFLKLVGISCFIAFPVATWVMHNWLNNYDYRVQINWPIFVLTGLLALVIAMITISFNAIKAAVANPVNSLRSE